MRIPLMDLQAQVSSLEEELFPLLQQKIKEASFIGGKDLQEFEAAFSEALKAPQSGIEPFCIGCGNGTDALFLALKCLNIGTGDLVVTAANSFVASAEAIVHAGADVVFCDIDPLTGLLDLNDLERLLRQHPERRRIRALMPVHLYGRSVNMTKLMQIAEQHQLVVVEDCAQSHLSEWQGQKTGTFGEFGAFSFYPGKNLGAFGDGGALVTTDEKLALKARKIVNHGRTAKYDHDEIGYNSRLDAIQALVLKVKLKHLPAWSAARHRLAVRYNQLLAPMRELFMSLPEIPEFPGYVGHLYVVRVQKRDLVRKKLQEDGVQTGIHYPIAIPALKAFSDRLYTQAWPTPQALQAQDEILSLPLYPELTEEQQDWVVERLVFHLQSR